MCCVYDLKLVGVDMEGLVHSTDYTCICTVGLYKLHTVKCYIGAVHCIIERLGSSCSCVKISSLSRRKCHSMLKSVWMRGVPRELRAKSPIIDLELVPQ